MRSSLQWTRVPIRHGEPEIAIRLLAPGDEDVVRELSSVKVEWTFSFADD